MRRYTPVLRILAWVASLLPVAPRADAQADEPSWAYAVMVPGLDDTMPYTLPDSGRFFTRREIVHPFGPADWYPNDHPLMPPIVATGREPDVIACALCHYPNGKGRPDSGSVAGLAKDYIVRQLRDFRAGTRRSAVPLKADTSMMTTIAHAMTEDEIASSAAYFSAMPWTPWISVIETEAVPVTRLRDGLHVEVDVEDGSPLMEPIGARILEVAAIPERAELRDPRTGFVAYVPLGAIAAGEVLAKTGGGRTTPCATCHRADLDGLGAAPGIRGRSPSYVARQLYDFQRGTRRGLMAEQMSVVVASLSTYDILNLSAYLASLEPVRAR
jgi:cytochrome c553